MTLVTLPPRAVVIDIETKDTLPTACVLSVGYAVVNMRALTIISKGQIYADLNEQIGRSVSDSTMKFWADHPEAWARQISSKRWPIGDVFAKLDSLAPFLSTDLVQPTWWGYGPSFDLVVLESLARDCGYKVPWTYRQHRDLRTLFELTGIKPAGFRHALGSLEHDAMDDAETEATAMLAALRMLGHEPVEGVTAFSAEAMTVDVPAVSVGA